MSAGVESRLHTIVLQLISHDCGVLEMSESQEGTVKADITESFSHAMILK